jgi:hypothetical protein
LPSPKKPGDKKGLRFVGNPEALEPTLKQVGGSQSDDWNLVLANQAITFVTRSGDSSAPMLYPERTKVRARRVCPRIVERG